MKKTIRDYDLKGKKIIIRCDLNVPIKDGVITDDTRIKASLKTIKYACENEAKIILMSHLGKIKNVDDLKKNDLYPVSIRLSELLGKEVLFSKNTKGIELEKMIDNLNNGDILLIQNTRYEDLDGKKESSCDLELSKYWASLGELFINDAYGTCHREHASNVGISKYLPSGLGFLVENEITKLDSIINEDTKPFVVIMGGAKVSDKIAMIENLITKCDRLLIGGGMAYTFLKALNYNVGASLVDYEKIDFCKNILANYSEKIILPIDNRVATSIDSDNYEIKDITEMNDKNMGLDIGPKTIELFKGYLKDARRVIINGPMGLFENSNYTIGTKSLYDCIIDNNIKTLVGGGDSAASVNKLSDASKFYHISTGGGATLEYLEGKDLPGISVIDEKE
jgi:phosphoglycerate kinase